MVHLDLGLCTVRSWRLRDAASLVRYANDPEVWANVRDRFPHPYTARDAQEFLAGASREGASTQFAIAVGEEAVGGIGFHPCVDVERISAELGYWLGRDWWGRGITTAAVRAVTEHAFRAESGLNRIFAIPFAWNRASARVLEKAGFSLEGRMRQSAIKDGRITDQLLYSKLRSEIPISPTQETIS